MAILGEDEILARVHRFKLFRTEATCTLMFMKRCLENLPQIHRRPNVLLKESEEKFFGWGYKERCFDRLPQEDQSGSY